jgi:hypothetical protein
MGSDIDDRKQKGAIHSRPRIEGHRVDLFADSFDEIGPRGDGESLGEDVEDLVLSVGKFVPLGTASTRVLQGGEESDLFAVETSGHHRDKSTLAKELIWQVISVLRFMQLIPRDVTGDPKIAVEDRFNQRNERAHAPVDAVGAYHKVRRLYLTILKSQSDGIHILVHSNQLHAVALSSDGCKGRKSCTVSHCHLRIWPTLVRDRY